MAGGGVWRDVGHDLGGFVIACRAVAATEVMGGAMVAVDAGFESGQ